MKLLKWEPGGFVLFYKHLERGTFELPDLTVPGIAQQIGYGQLTMMVTGISMRFAKNGDDFYYKMMLINIAESLIYQGFSVVNFIHGKHGNGHYFQRRI